jgi:YHS domain-containing protein
MNTMHKKSLLKQLARLSFSIFAGLFMLGSVSAQALNLDKKGVAIQGHDPVAFFTQNKPVKGKAALSSQSGGATYYFSTVENKKAFEAEPAKYIPQFGGYCAYGVSKGDLVEIEVDAFQIVDGRLLLQYSKKIRDTFNTDQKGLLKKADANWPAVSQKKPTGFFGF